MKELPTPIKEAPRKISGFRARMQEKITTIDKVADWMTNFFGSTSFLWGNFIFFIFWILLNSRIFKNEIIIDPFPFNFLTMAVSLEAIFLSIIVLMSQNRSAKIDNIREEVNFEIDVRSEAEITKILNIVDELHNYFGLPHHRDKELSEMKQNIDVMQMRHEIEDSNK
ncbi:MAG: DUF1003 domain-containing protein [Candidatus Pacebacteria bacterium]|nr:DUF1003 domain-containing protein [Candidatus Paceibacterota bacterium]